MAKVPDVAVESFDPSAFTKISPIKKAIRSKALPLIVLLLAMIGAFAIIAPIRNDGFQAFFRPVTIWRILQNIAVPGFLTLGVGCLLISGQFDFSGASVGSLGGIIVGVGISKWGLHWGLTIAIALGVAVAVGLINGLIVNELKQPSFIATMAMSTIMTAVMMILAPQGAPFVSKPVELISDYRLFGSEITAASVVMVLFFIIYGLALSKTKFGRTLYLMGGNSTATRLAGINPKRTSYFLFINGAVLGCVAGILNVSRTQNASLAGVSSYQFTGMTSAILGGISFGGGSGGMGGAFVGLMVINTFNMGITTSRGSTYLTQVLSGGLLLIALTFDYFSVRAQNRRVGA